MGAREVMEQELERYSLVEEQWAPITNGSLPETAITEITKALIQAESPFMVVGFSGRHQQSVLELVRLADRVKGLRVYDAGTTESLLPIQSPACISPITGSAQYIEAADCIIVLDCDVPWMPIQHKPRPDVRISHVDIGPLEAQMSLFYIPATARYRADSLAAPRQLNTYVSSSSVFIATLSSPLRTARWDALVQSHSKALGTITAKAAPSTWRRRRLSQHILSQCSHTCHTSPRNHLRHRSGHQPRTHDRAASALASRHRVHEWRWGASAGVAARRSASSSQPSISHRRRTRSCAVSRVTVPSSSRCRRPCTGSPRTTPYRH